MFGKQNQPFKGWFSSAGLTRCLVVGLVLLVLSSGVMACSSPTPTPQVDPVPSPQAQYAGKKIVWVDSYHQGYEWSDGVEKGIRETLDGTGVELKVVRMDTNRNPGAEFGKAAGLAAKAEIDAFQPDVIIACDDNAQEYLIVPYYKDTSMPVIFCGVNWDASPYGYPASNVTGMIEVDFVPQMVENLKEYAQGERVGYLSGDRSTDRKLAEIYNDRFFDGQMKVSFVKTFDEFKAAFLDLQEDVDILYIGNNAGIEGWDDEQARQFCTENTKIPSGTRQPWLAPYVLMVLGRFEDEQGIWSAQAALQVLDGTPISQIPMSENKKIRFILNLDIADELGVVFSPSLLRNAEIFGSEETQP